MLDKLSPNTLIADYGVALTLVIILILLAVYYIRKRINYLEKVWDDELEEKKEDRKLRREESRKKLASEEKTQDTTLQFNALLTDAINFQTDQIRLNSDNIDRNTRQIEENSTNIMQHDNYFKNYSVTAITRFDSIDSQLVEIKKMVDKIQGSTKDPKTKEELEEVKNEISNHIEKK